MRCYCAQGHALNELALGFKLRYPCSRDHTPTCCVLPKEQTGRSIRGSLGRLYHPDIRRIFHPGTGHIQWLRALLELPEQEIPRGLSLG